MNIEKNSITQISTGEELIHMLYASKGEYSKKEIVLNFIKNTTAVSLTEMYYTVINYEPFDGYKCSCNAENIRPEELIIHCINELRWDLLGAIISNENCPVELILNLEDSNRDNAFQRCEMSREKLIELAKEDKRGFFSYEISSQKNFTPEIYKLMKAHLDEYVFIRLTLNKNLSEEIFELFFNDFKDCFDDFEGFIYEILQPEDIILQCQERFLDRIMNAILSGDNSEEIKTWVKGLYKQRTGKNFKVH